MNIKEIVKDNSKAKFSHFSSGSLYYTVARNGIEICQFPINTIDKDDKFNSAELGTTAFLPEYKAITLMRYIRKAIEKDNIIFLQPV